MSERKKTGRPSIVKSKEDEQYIRDNYLTMTYAEIGEKIGLTGKQVEGWVCNHMPTRKRKRREINDTYFDVIDTPEKAYWLGFIYADGWISKHNTRPADERHKHESTGCEFGMQLQRCDEYVLDRLNAVLGGQNTVKRIHTSSRIVNNQHCTESDSSVLRVYSKPLVEGLHKNGIDFNKSKSDMFPIVDDWLFPDYLRGIIDGDGCIHHMRGNHLAVHITGACLPCFEYIQFVLRWNYNIATRIYEEDCGEEYRKKYRLYCFRNEDVYNLLKLIYYDDSIPKLERKYEIYQTHYGLAA